MSTGCYDCELPYEDPRFPDMLIPTWAWKRIMGHEGGLLCPNCIIGRLEAHGLEKVPSYFGSGPLCMGSDGEPVWMWKERLLRLEESIETSTVDSRQK